MADRFPRPNLNPAAAPWSRAVEKRIQDQEARLAAVLQRVESAGRILSASRGRGYADGGIYRSNGIVVPQGVDQFTIYGGTSEDDDAGDPYAAFVLSDGGFASMRSAHSTGLLDIAFTPGDDPPDLNGYPVLNGLVRITPHAFEAAWSGDEHETGTFNGGELTGGPHFAVLYQWGNGPNETNTAQSAFLKMLDGFLSFETGFHPNGSTDMSLVRFNIGDWIKGYYRYDGESGFTPVIEFPLTGGGVSAGGGGGSGGGPSILNASTTARGIIEVATNAEVSDGQDTERAVTPAALRALLDSMGTPDGGGGSGSGGRNLADAFQGAWTPTFSDEYEPIAQVFFTGPQLVSGMTLDNSAGGTAEVLPIADFYPGENASVQGTHAVVLQGDGNASPLLRWEVDVPESALLRYGIRTVEPTQVAHYRDDVLWEEYGAFIWGQAESSLSAGHRVLTWRISPDASGPGSVGISKLEIVVPSSTPTSDYARGDLVVHAGYLWLCRVSQTAEMPNAQATDWSRLAVYQEQDPSGAGGGTGGSADLRQVTVPNGTTDGWFISPTGSSGVLRPGYGGLVLEAQASSFVRYVYTTSGFQKPVGLGPTELVWEMVIDSTSSEFSAGMALTDTGEDGAFNLRIDVHADGSVGCRFEADGQYLVTENSDLSSVWNPGDWNTVRFVRHRESAIAYVNGQQVLGTDDGPNSKGLHPTLLAFGGQQDGYAAAFRNISARLTSPV